MWISKNAENCTYTPPLGQKNSKCLSPLQKIFWKQCHNSLFCIFLPLGMATRHALKNPEIFRNFQEIRRGPWTPAAGFRPMANRWQNPWQNRRQNRRQNRWQNPRQMLRQIRRGSMKPSFKFFYKVKKNSVNKVSTEFIAYDRQRVSFFGKSMIR